jgi:hypothetical protein
VTAALKATLNRNLRVLIGLKHLLRQSPASGPNGYHPNSQTAFQLVTDFLQYCGMQQLLGITYRRFSSSHFFNAIFTRGIEALLSRDSSNFGHHPRLEWTFFLFLFLWMFWNQV